LGATSNKRCFGGTEKKVREELDPRSLEVGTIGYLMEYLEGNELSNARTIQAFSLQNCV